MSNSFSLSGKHAIITGGTRGIGLAIAASYLEAGAKVTVCSRKQEGVDAAVAELNSENVQGFAVHVGKPDDITRLIETAQDKFGPANVLVNNAGTNPYYGPILDSTDLAREKTMDVNLKGPYMLSREAAKVMARELGRKGIRVNCICPGVVKTKLSEAMWENPDAEKHVSSLKALGRIGTTDELAGAALYFASDASSFTTGAVLTVDGGMVV
jgi:dehydrogenase/reductase SDR family protein 4